MKNDRPTIEHLSIDALVPYARNSRTHSAEQVAQIAGSIKEFGFTNPVLIDADGGIIAGHGRVMAARKLGLTEVPCIRLAYLTDAQKRAYVIADNKLALNAGWDDAMLKLEFAELKEEGIDLAITGFSVEEIAELTLDDNANPDADAEPQIDQADELREKWGVETGQLWQLGDHRILCGDSTKAEDVARALDGVKPMLMVTDPPYGVEYDAERRFVVGRQSVKGGAVGKVTNDDRADWREAWALFPGNVAYVWHAMKTQHAVATSLMESGMDIRSEIVWAKSSAPPLAYGINAEQVEKWGLYHPQHESCFYAVRKGATAQWAGDRKQTTLWEIDKPHKSETGHSTQKPFECMARPIRNHESELVYEPFSGSGTTIIACEQLGRKCRAIEISPAYVAVAIQRWADATGKEPRKLS